MACRPWVGGAAVARMLLVVCACSAGRVANQPQTAGRADSEHTYRADGWIVKNEPAAERWWRQTSMHRSSGSGGSRSADGLDLTPTGMEQAAFILSEMGHEAHAQRALAAGARYFSSSMHRG